MNGVYLTNKELRALLKKRGACDDALRWLGTRDLPTAWMECPRSDWLAWLIDVCGDVIGVPGYRVYDRQKWRWDRGADFGEVRDPGEFRAKLTPRMVKR